MIILKYGNAKKLESAKRWKCKCSECGCKVILDKDDVQNYKHDMDSDYHRVTKFNWTCPYCEEELYHEEYDDPLVRITEPILDKIEDFAVYHEELCVVIVLVLVSALCCLLVWGGLTLAYKYYDNKYSYRIEYIEDDGDHRIDWTNELEEKGQHVIYIDEDGDKKKQDIDMVVITNLKEEE